MAEHAHAQKLINARESWVILPHISRRKKKNQKVGKNGRPFFFSNALKYSRKNQKSRSFFFSNALKYSRKTQKSRIFFFSRIFQGVKKIKKKSPTIQKFFYSITLR